MLLERGPDRGYFPDPEKSHFIADTHDQKEAVNREFEAEGLKLNFVRGSWYLGGVWVPGKSWGVGATPKGGMVPQVTHTS